MGYLPKRRYVAKTRTPYATLTKPHIHTGVVFLFRIGLALVTCCRRTLRDVRTEADALAVLAHPQRTLLPSSPATLIELSSSFRLKDDDIRKKRDKLEAQVKQSRLSGAARRSSRGILSSHGPAITLPSRG